MSSNTLGILIIIGLIVIAFATKGDIFRGNSVGTFTFGTQSTSNESGLGESSSSNGASSGTSGSGNGGSFGKFLGIYSRNNNETVIPNASPYAEKVYMNFVNEPGTFNEYFDISTNLDNDESVLVTGWKIRSTVTGREITIGGGAVIPTVGVRDQSPISLANGDEMYVVPGVSPIGTSFKVNACAGFFTNGRVFNPSISPSCPDVNYAPPRSAAFNDTCLDFIDNLPRCHVPNERDFPRLRDDEDQRDTGIKLLTSSCKSFLLTRVNYPTCVANHLTDKNFFRQEWRVYAGRHGIFSLDRRDQFLLIDNAGLVVDSYSYDR